MIEQSINKIEIRATFIKTINFAGHQNAVPILRDLIIVNHGEEPLEHLTLTISAHPGFLKQRLWMIDRINAGSEVKIEESAIEYDATMLFGLNEAITANIELVLSDQEQLSLATLAETVRVLAKNEWGGSHFLPELLAAFVQPNDVAVESLQKTTAELLRRHNILLNGYASGRSEIIWSMLSAIWSAVAGLKLDYALPPASFEEVGQKIRTPSHVIESGLATCLDSTLLFASVIEALQLHPIVILVEGHAFVGCWLKPEEFKSAVVDDVIAIRKAVSLDQLVLFETTLAVQHPPASFTQAIQDTKRAISEEKEHLFSMAIDIKRSRIQKIFPLPSSQQITTSYGEVEVTAVLDVEDPPPLPRFDIEPEVFVETPQSRLNRWQRKLLDLSLRNKLLNFKPSKKGMVLLCKKPGLLEDIIADGKDITLSPLPDLTGGEGGRNEAIYSQMHKTSLTEEFINDALERSFQVYVPLSKAALDSSLIELYRQAKSDIEEGGANTLFLAIGFLAWKKDSADTRRYKAPLILIPVTLIRQGVGADMRLKLHDDEPRFNSSLVEMLKQDFEVELPNLETLPSDESGIDVQKVWDKVKVGIHDLPGFEVLPEVALSTFSFAKYLMWKDLVDRTDQLKNNKVVAHLIDTPREVYESSTDQVNPKSLDEVLHPNQVFCPLTMDSSQLAAVIEAQNGKDFVLIGPPGTGKSQTISNMIAHLLGIGKTVLFVAEKSAALSVVYRRLSQQNLGEFCLELHSNKAKKIEVLAQLGRALQVQSENHSEAWELLTQNLKRQRDILNSFVQHLHQVHPNGMSAYRAIGLCAFNQELLAPTLLWPDYQVHSAQDYRDFIELCEEMTVAINSVGGLAQSEFKLIQAQDWAPSWQAELIERANSLANSSIKLQGLIDQLGLEIGISIPVDRQHELFRGVIPWIDALKKIADNNFDKLIRLSLTSLQKDVRQAQIIQSNRRKLINKLSISYQNGVEAKVDVNALVTLHRKSLTAWWPMSMLLKMKAAGLLKPFAAGKPNLNNDVEIIEQLSANRREFNEYQVLSESFQLEWDEFNTDFDKILQCIKEAESHADSLLTPQMGEAPLGAYIKQLQVFKSNYTRFLPEETLKTLNDEMALSEDLERAVRELKPSPNGIDFNRLSQSWLIAPHKLSPSSAIGSKILEIFEAQVEFLSQRASFEALAVGTLVDLPSEITPFLSSVSNTLQSLVAKSTHLKSWCDWQRYKKIALSKGLQPLIEGCEIGLIPIDKIKDGFELGYAKWWLNKLVDHDEVLRKFSPAQHERIIDKFRELDAEYQDLTKKYIRSLLASNQPKHQPGDKSSKEIGLLQKELSKKSRHIPLRTLISKMPNDLTQLTPCLLMSPLSVAQYLPTDQALFDVVIFDEASQITVWDAVGAIARGKQTVIVGDPKQLPPSNFFGRADTDGIIDDVAVEDDLESILDEALGCRISRIDLQWHYRSLHESLIAFSNYKYYDGKLVTFPATTTLDDAVRFVEVINGVYDKGNTRTNQAEAQQITAEILKRLNVWKTLPEAKRPSIGVVTFNSEQQSLIENMIETEVRKNPDLAWFFSDSCLEPVLVKNIENIQGDERDVMLFSITYGPDAAGKVSMNFGPMNRDGGERRLNVAITRARREMIVYSTLGPEKIDLTRTQAIGVRDLKDFLTYAKHGPTSLAKANDGSVGEYDSLFEIAVSNALMNKGWRVIPQIGASSYRIDLGIVHPKNPGEFLCGIECDGATYHRSATARDRDKLREQILRGLGWNILRVWSTDWWIDANGATEKLHQSLLKLLNLETSAIAAVEADSETVK